MASVDSALAGVQERDKWRRRLEVLEASLGEVRERRRRLEVRLRKIRRELQRLERTAREYVGTGPRGSRSEVTGVPRGPLF